MTGKPFYKTRTITSERLVSPLAGRRDLNDAALAFKKAVVESITFKSQSKLLTHLVSMVIKQLLHQGMEKKDFQERR